MLFKLGWDRIEARLVDRRLVKLVVDNNEPGGYQHEVCDYIVQFAGLDGEQMSLVVRENSSLLDLPAKGHKVPILVNKKRTKAAFDRKGTAIDAIGNMKRREAEQRARDEERFRGRLP